MEPGTTTTRNYVLFLDDERSPPLPSDVRDQEVVHAKNFWEFKNTIEERGEPLFVMFDWYLGSGAPNGLDTANWLIEYDKEHDILSRDLVYHSHSSDWEKARDIVALLANHLAEKFGNDVADELREQRRRVRSVGTSNIPQPGRRRLR